LRPDKDGATVRQHLESVERQLKKRPAQLDGPPMPEELRYLWRWFWELHAGRTVNGMSHTRASHHDIWAWQQNFRIAAQPWELRTLMQLGVIWLNVMNEELPGG